MPGSPDSPAPRPADGPARPILTAELLSVGSEILAGETRDTNAGDLARDLVAAGVGVNRILALPDRLPIVAAAFSEALERVDVVISTGGLGPTPDDLTREAIAATVGETPAVDPELEAWLRGLYERRRVPFPLVNLKQAWRIPSATALPNPNGTAPGWWVDRPDGRVIIALPGPPREMRPMWADHVLPRLRVRELGRETVVRTLRLAGIGESLVAERLGDVLLRAANPIVATYARAEAVDVRISAVAGPDGTPPAALVAAAETAVRAVVGDHVWAEGTTTWAEAIEARLAAAGWDLAVVEVGTHGSVLALLGEGTRRLIAAEACPALHKGLTLAALARDLRERSGAAVVLAVRAMPRRGDTSVEILVSLPTGNHRERRLAFLAGAPGRARAALAAAAVLVARLPR